MFRAQKRKSVKWLSRHIPELIPCQRDWQATLEQAGYKVGVANPALFYNAEECCRGGVHGDDFVVVGSRRALDRMGKTSSGMYSMRESHRLGSGSHCESHAELLNRNMPVGTNSDGRRYVRIEPDVRHAELVLRDQGLEGSKVKPLTTPGFKLDEREVALRETEVPLEEIVVLFPGSSRLERTSEVLSQVYGKANTREPQRSQEDGTLFVGYQTHGPSLGSSNFAKQHFDQR